ncbi:autotransporter domain-containing protein [Shimia sediminis]|uniref:autotransporter domain-containing protein n=1 Tax=Shimia sediminis TaxID=2497945 RepID=UPI000F8F5F07|nr:autotransporter domain-containing protein [Shimia sediminis]
MKRSLAFLCLMTLGANSALAQALTCDTFNGTSGTIAIRQAYSVSLQAGETITAGTTTPTTTNMEIGSTLCGPRFSGGSCQGVTYTAASAESVSIEVVYTSAGVSGPVGAQYSFACGTGGGGGGGGTSSEAAAEGAAAAAVGAGGQNTAVGNALGNALAGRNGNGGATATRNGMFLSTQGESGTWSYWAGLSGRHFSGDFDGDNVDLVFGVDVEVGGNTILGLAGAYGMLDITASGTRYEADTFAIGPYLQTRFGGGLELEAYVMYGEPDYTVAGATKFDAERVFGGLKLTGEVPVNWAVLRPSVGYRGFSEKMPAHTVGLTAVPARTVSQNTANVSLRMDFHETQGGLFPYLTVGLDFNDFDDGLGGGDTYVSPRLAAGFKIESRTGTFTVDLDGGEIADGTNDVGLTVLFSRSF